MRQRTVEFFGIQKEIHVIHNFVNCSLYRPQPEAQMGRKRIMHISNFRPVKRVMDCIRAFAEVRREVDAELIMAGDGPDRGPAEALARDLGVEEAVVFLGKQDHVERLIPQAHALHLPSELESFGLAALEAMACGVVPVSTRTGGVPDLISHGHDGFMEEVGDIEAHAYRLTELLTNEPLRERMAAAARETALRRFCTDLLIPRYEALYRQVCEESN
jgi:N-acetyl-alpha-D-glucosaminyl L-malate synthase BshA